MQREVSLPVYQAMTARTCVVEDQAEMLKLGLIGLLGEAGEVSEPLKKYLYAGRALDTAHLQEEMGDVLWYLATICNATGLSLEAAIASNIAKMQARFPACFENDREERCS